MICEGYLCSSQLVVITSVLFCISNSYCVSLCDTPSFCLYPHSHWFRHSCVAQQHGILGSAKDDEDVDEEEDEEDDVLAMPLLPASPRHAREKDPTNAPPMVMVLTLLNHTE